MPKTSANFRRSLKDVFPAGLLLAGCFAVPLYRLFRFALGSDLYSHILVVPFISGWLIWSRRHDWPLPSRQGRGTAVIFFLLGLAILAPFWLWPKFGGHWPVQDGLSLTGVSFLLMLLGVVDWRLGPAALRFLAFPLGVLVFMVPAPVFLTDLIEKFLQHASAATAYGLFLVSGMPVLAEGGLRIQLPGIDLDVAPQCSGLRSSLALLVTSLPAGYFFLRSPWRRTALSLSAIVLGILRNGFRIFVIGELCVHIGPRMIDSYIHRTGGWIFFVLSLAPFFLILGLLARGERQHVRRRLLLRGLAGTLALSCLINLGCTRRSALARHWRRADSYFAAGQYEQAEIEYRAVLKADGRNAAAIARLGVIYFEQGRIAAALPLLLAAQKAAPGDLEVRTELGHYYLSALDFSAARNEAEIILSRDPRNGEAPVIWAEAAARSDRAEAVRRRLRSLADASGRPAPELVALGALELSQGRAAAAAALFHDALLRDPKSAAACSALASYYWAQKDAGRARQYFAEAARLSPDRSPRRIQYAQFQYQTGDKAEARRTLHAMMEKTPDYLPAAVLLAGLDETDQKYGEAGAVVAEVLRRDPANGEALLLRGRLLLAQARPDLAVAALEKAQRLYPRSPPLLYALARAYAISGEKSKAMAALNQAVAVAPGFADAVMLRARIKFQNGDREGAIIDLKGLVQSRPELASARFLIASAYLGENDFDDAQAIYRQLAAASPRDPQPLYLQGLAWLRQGRREEAREAFGRASGLSPDYGPALEQLTALDVGEKRYAAAEGRIAARLAVNPADASLQVLMGRVWLAEKRWEQAATALRRAIHLDPGDSTPYFLLGELYFTSRQEDAALASLQQVLAKNPRDCAALMLVGVIEGQKRRYGEARAAYEKILAIDPNFSAALNNLAYIYSEQPGQLDKAGGIAQRARTLLPNEPHVADTLGWILYRRRQYGRAAALLRESALALADDALIQFHLGMAEYMLGDESAAQTALRQALQIDPGFTGSEEARSGLAVLAVDVAGAGPVEHAFLEKMAASRPTDPMVAARLAGVCARQGAVERAVAICEEAVRQNPQNASALIELAQLEAPRDFDRALALAKSAYEMAPDDAVVARVLGRFAGRKGDALLAVSLLQASAYARPHDVGILFDLAQASYRLGRTADAERSLRQALAVDAGFAKADEAKRLLEMMELEEGGPPSAADEGRVRRRLQEEPDCLPALMAEGAFLEGEGRAAGALGMYEKAIAIDPGFLPAKKHLAICYASDPSPPAAAYQIGKSAEEAFPLDPEVSKAFGILAYRTGRYAEAANFLQKLAARPDGDAETIYYHGMALFRLQNRAAGGELKRALAAHLTGRLADQARDALAKRK